MFANSGQHGSFVEFKVGRQLNPNKFQALQLGADAVHDKTRQRRKNRSTRNIADHGQQADQLVRAIAQHDVKAFRHVGIVGQGSAQVIDAATGVTVQRQSAEPLAEFSLKRRRQPMWVLHGVKLDHAGGVLHRVGVHGLDVGANAGPGVVFHRVSRI